MPFGYDGKEIKIGDKIVRTKKFLNQNGWPYGEEICIVKGVSSSCVYIDGVGVGWIACYFEKVKEMSLPCVRITPAQAEKIEIVHDKLTQFFIVVPTLDKKFISLRNTNLDLIGTMDADNLRRNAKAFNDLADVLDRIK